MGERRGRRKQKHHFTDHYGDLEVLHKDRFAGHCSNVIAVGKQPHSLHVVEKPSLHLISLRERVVLLHRAARDNRLLLRISDFFVMEIRGFLPAQGITGLV